MNLLVILAIVGVAVYVLSQSATAAASSASTTGTPSATETPASASPSSVLADPANSAPNVLPPPAVALPPANPIETGVPLQHAGILAGLYTLLSATTAPGALLTAGDWNQILSGAWTNFGMQSGFLMYPGWGVIPDATTVFQPIYPQFDGTQKMSLETYWSAVGAYLKANQGLSGVRSWAV